MLARPVETYDLLAWNVLSHGTVAPPSRYFLLHATRADCLAGHLPHKLHGVCLLLHATRADCLRQGHEQGQDGPLLLRATRADCLWILPTVNPFSAASAPCHSRGLFAAAVRDLAGDARLLLHATRENCMWITRTSCRPAWTSAPCHSRGLFGQKYTYFTCYFEHRNAINPQMHGHISTL